jgi:MtrB/PioB family decaheme-associated outer membrane protein
MKRIHTLVAAAFLAGVVGAAPLAAETNQSVEVGLQDVSQNQAEAKFEEYKDVPQGLVFEEYALDVNAANYDLDVKLENLFQDDQSAALDYNRKGKLWFKAGWDQAPHRWGESAFSFFDQTAPGVYAIDDAMQSFFQANPGSATWWNNISTFTDRARAVPLEARADTLSLNLGGALSEGWSVDFNFSQQEKHGNQLLPVALGRSFALELAKEVDQTVYDSGVALNYASEKTTLALSYGMNVYENAINTLVWDNPKRLTDAVGDASRGDGAAQGRYSNAPDNLAHNTRLSASVQLPARSRFVADISATRMTQDEDLLPYSINSALSAGAGFDVTNSSNLPANSAGTEMTLWTQNYQLSNRLLKNVALGLRARSEQLGNDSDEILFTGHTVLDQTWSGTDEETIQFGYRKLNLGAYADWNLTPYMGLGVEYAHETTDRLHREYEETKEPTWTGRLTYNSPSWFRLRGRVIHAERYADGFDMEHYMSNPTTWIENPGIRRYDIAARNRNAGDLQMTAWGGPLTVTLNGSFTQDRFKPGDGDLYIATTAISATNQNLQFGLLSSRVVNGGADFGWDITENADLSTYYQMSLVRNVQRQNQNTGGTVSQNVADNYTLWTIDRYDAVGVGLNTALTDRTGLRLGYDLAFSRGAFEYKELGSAVATKQSLPDTRTSKQDYSVKADYKASKDVSLTLGYLFEIYNITDFATDDMPLATGRLEAQTNLTLGDTSEDYKAHVVSLMMKYKW